MRRCTGVPIEVESEDKKVITTFMLKENTEGNEKQAPIPTSSSLPSDINYIIM